MGSSTYYCCKMMTYNFDNNGVQYPKGCTKGRMCTFVLCVRRLETLVPTRCLSSTTLFD